MMVDTFCKTWKHQQPAFFTKLSSSSSTDISIFCSIVQQPVNEEASKTNSLGASWLKFEVSPSSVGWVCTQNDGWTAGGKQNVSIWATSWILQNSTSSYSVENICFRQVEVQNMKKFIESVCTILVQESWYHLICQHHHNSIILIFKKVASQQFLTLLITIYFWVDCLNTNNKTGQSMTCSSCVHG